MQSQLVPGYNCQRSSLNWCFQRSLVLRRKLHAKATSGAAPQPTKELSKDIVTRQYRRTVYDFSLWSKHRDVNRYLYNLKTIPGSRIIRVLGQPMGVVLAWAALFGFYETCLESDVLPAYLPKLTLTSAEPQGLTSFALSLLLVFRTNSSYGRFDEARKIWGGILNRARNIANQAVTFIPPEDAAGREAVAKWTVGFCRALQAHLQEDADLRTELAKAQPAWSAAEIDMLCSAQHRPIKAISMLSELTRQLPINHFQALQMQENVTFFYDALGGCERLLRTPIPVSYTRHTARFLIIWLSLLPLGLWDRYHWSMLPVIALIGFLLLGIDEIGITIEEPFGILPLDAICTRAQTDVASLLKDDPAVSQYITDIRQGRIKPPPAAYPTTPPSPQAPASSSTTTSASVSSTSSSPAGQQQQPDLLRSVSSLFSNVRMGTVVTPAPPPVPRTPSPSSSRARSPRSSSPRAGSPGSPFPPASAGTGRVMPTAAATKPVPEPAAAMASRGNTSSGGKAAAADVSGNGFIMQLSKSGAAAASKLTKLADAVTAGSTPPAEGAKPALTATAPSPPTILNSKAMERPAVQLPHSSASSSSGLSEAVARNGDETSSNGSNWRKELATLHASREEGRSSVPVSSATEDYSLAAARGVVGGDTDDEVMRRFGGLAGRSRNGDSVGTNGNGHGNGNGRSANGNGDGYGSVVSVSSGSSNDRGRARPRTRPDWRNQL